jgi:DNA-binding NtrC family response regulator
MERTRILIVDDEEDLVSTMAERLALRGWHAETCTSGADALARLAGEDFGVLVLDVKMPGIDGLDLLAQLKRKRPELPVILFTGHATLADAQRGMEEGAFDYIVKPVDIEELIGKIRMAVGLEEDGRP